MEITYQGLRIVLPLKDVLQVEDFTFHASFNSHAGISLLLLMEEDGIEAAVHEMGDGAYIEVYEGEILFKGKITWAGMASSRGLHYLKLKALSYTRDWSLAPVSQGFLNLDATYEQVMRKVLSDQPGADIMDCVTGGAVIPDFLLQYEETDWDFLVRLASHFQSFLIPDYTSGQGRAYFGIPKQGEEFNLSGKEYRTVKDMERFYRVNLDGQLLPQETMGWSIRADQAFRLAQRVRFCDISAVVTEITYRVVEGELVRFYELRREKGCLSVPIKNTNIYGMSIPATVKERSGNCVRVQLAIDREYDASPHAKYFTYAIESSFIYCMPEVESQVHIYFPSDEEKDAIAVHAIRMAAPGQAAGKGYAQNPAYKSFSNVNGAELLLAPEFASVSSDKGQTASIQLDTEGNVSVFGTEISIEADKCVSLGDPMDEGGEAAGNVVLYGGTVTAQIGEGDGTKAELTEEVKIIAAFVRLEGSAAPVESPPFPTVEEMTESLTAGDAQAMADANSGASQMLVDKYEAGRKKMLDGAFRVLSTVAVVTVIVVGTVATGGAAALAAPGIIAVCTLGTTTVVSGVADFAEGVGDVQKSQSGDLSESYNFVRDTAFSIFGENKQLAYDIAKMVNDIAFGVVSGKALAGMSGFKLVCGGKELKSLKMALQAGSGMFNGAVRNLIDTGSINTKDLLINTTIGLFQGYMGTSVTSGIMSRLGKGMSPFATKAVTAGVGTVVDTTMEGIMSKLFGKDFDIKESLGRNAFANSLAAFIADPVDAATGGYIIHTTDFILASLPQALELKRTYCSASRSVSCLGRGWTFSYGSRICRDTEKEGRIHMDTITGHALWFEKEDGRWVNQSRGTQRFSLEADEENGQFTLADAVDHTVCLYGGDGQIRQVEYPNRQRLTFSYKDGNLSRITTPLGNYLDIESRDGKLLQISDEIGRRIQYRYEGDLLTEVVHPDEGMTHYEYDEGGYIAAVTDENGVRYLENRYDKQGRVICQQFKNGVHQDFAYDDKYRRNSITYSETGRREVYEYNKELLPVRVSYEDGTCVVYEYSDQNLRTGQISRAGARTTWEYDAKGRQICEARLDGYEFHQEYDEQNDLVRTWNTDGRETANRYDENHNLVSVREKISDGQWKETAYRYDGKGRRISARDGVGNVTEYQFDENRAYPKWVITPKKEETAYGYDKAGRRMTIKNPYGEVELSYNSRNFVTRRTDGEGYTSRWFYDRMGNLTDYYPARNWKEKLGGYRYRYDFLERLVDTESPLGEHRRLFRNFDGKVTREIHPVSYEEKGENGEGIRYEYDQDGNQIRIHYPDGGTERRFYDVDGNLTRQVLPESYDRRSDDGPGYAYAYDVMSRLIRVCDPEGNELRRYEYNGHGQVLKETDGEGKETLYRYNGLGLKTREQVSVRKDGETLYYRVIAYKYDSQGNKIEEAYGKEEVEKDGTPAGWHKIHFSYDKNNRLSSVEDGFGAKVRYEYDCLGNRTLEEQAIEDGISRRIRYGYNKNGWRISRTEEIQGNGAVSSAVTRYEYDESGNLTGTVTPGGFEIRRSYDADDRLIEERTLDKKNGIDRRIRYGYDAAGNVTSETVQGAEGETLSTGYRYDLSDRLTHEVSQSGGVNRYIYDQNGRLMKEIRPYGYEAETDEGKGTAYYYDSRGNRIRETNGLGQVVEEQRYNLQDLPIMQRDGLGSETEYAYTQDGQLKDVGRGRGEKKQRLQEYKYNARGQIIGITDGVGETIRYGLDNWGRITTVGFSDGVEEGYAYTPSGQVSKATDGNRNAVQYRYNSLGKVRERIDQLGYAETFEYDEEGNLAVHTDRDGNQIYRTYNVFGSLVYEKAMDRNGENPILTTCRYDSLGRLVQAVCDGHSYEYSYNEQGRLKEKRSSGKRLISYEYDKAGQIIRMTDPAGIATCYEYDILGRTSRINSSKDMEVRYQYDCLNRLEQVTYGNGITTRYEYDGTGNLACLTTRFGEENLLYFQYQYDGNGNRTGKAGELRLAGGEVSSLHTSYRYNVRGQLLEENRNGESDLYSYDSAGNRTRKESPDGIASHRYNEKNQLISEEGIHGKKNFTYNHQGGIIREEGADGGREFLYNTKNQQVRVAHDNGTVQTNRYDAEGLRFEMKENEQLLRFVYHKGELLYERSGEEETGYHLGLGIEARQDGQGTHYYHQDEQLSTALITDKSGTIQNHYQYDAFGTGLGQSEQVSNRIRYTGQQYDVLTEQYYLRARYYNPILGRFMQEDVYQGDGLNLYAYCDNNPVIYCDPSGYASKCPPGGKIASGDGEINPDANKIFWGTWDDYEKVTVNGQDYAVVGGRLYSHHAVDRMQPSGMRYSSNAVGGPVGASRITDVSQVDYGRGVAPQYVEDVIGSTTPKLQDNGNLIYDGGGLNIITNQEGSVVTIMTK